MKQNELMALLDDCCHDFAFLVDGKASGIMPEVRNYQKTYHAWCGTAVKDFSTTSDVMTTPFFNGKTLNDLCDSLNIQLS